MNDIIEIFVTEEFEILPIEGKDTPDIFLVNKGKRIIIVHGRTDGTFGRASYKHIDDYKPDLIYCCHPKSVRGVTGDNRIQGTHDDKIMGRWRHTEDGRALIITIQRYKER